MSFALFRTGEFHLWYDLKSFLGREVHEQAIPPRKVELDSAEAVPPHAYYFVKDVTHRHYHHDPESDQLLLLSRLHPVTKTAEHEENELRWRRETLWGLARIIAQFRRKKDLDDYKRARGILAYADAFQSSLARIWRAPDIETPLEPHDRLFQYDFTHTKASVQSLEDVAAWRQNGLMQFVAVYVGIFLSSLALWAAAVEIRPILCQPPGASPRTSLMTCPPLHPAPSSDIALWVADSPLAFICILIVMGFAAFSAFIKSPRFFPMGRWVVVGLAKLAKALGVSAARRLRSRLGRNADVAGYLVMTAFLAIVLLTVVWLASARLF